MKIQKYIEKLNVSISNDQEMIDNLQRLEPIYNSSGKYEHHFIALKILEKLKYLKLQILKEPENLLLNYSTLRFTLETLIHARLMRQEESYVYKLFYSVYLHQINKIHNFIDRLKREIELISTFETLEENETNINPIPEELNKETIKEHTRKIKEIENDIYALAEHEMTVFFGDFVNNGFNFQRHIMENNILKSYEDKLRELLELKRVQEMKLYKDTRLTSIFDFSQPSSVFKELKDNRSWSKKAEDSNLKDEYKSVYEISSAILHSTSYSIITPVETSEQEQYFALGMIVKYSRSLHDNLKVFLDYDKITQIKIITLD